MHMGERKDGTYNKDNILMELMPILQPHK